MEELWRWDTIIDEAKSKSDIMKFDGIFRSRPQYSSWTWQTRVN